MLIIQRVAVMITLSIDFLVAINKSQGKAGLFLHRSIFSHGQLYVVVSRVKCKKGLKSLYYDREDKYTNSTHFVYKEALFRILARNIYFVMADNKIKQTSLKIIFR